jgi:ribosome maturation protein SDO1
MKEKLFDREKISLNLAKLKKGGEMFEVIIDPNKINDYKHKRAELKDVLLYDRIFSEAKKGLEASNDHMKALFETDDTLAVAKIIIEHGEIQYTQEYREEKRKEKYNKILDIITRNAVDPRTGLPHPRNRIEAAIEEAKIKVDDHKDAEDEVKVIVSKLKPILPIKLAIVELMIKVPGQFAGKAYPIVERFGKKVTDSWNTDGSWVCNVEVPAGMQNDFFDALNKLTHGDIESKVIREK